MELLAGNIEAFDVNIERGFLPKHDPTKRVNRDFDDLEYLAAELPELLAAKQVRKKLEKLSIPEASWLYPECYERAHMLAAYCAHACVWENWQDGTVIPVIPASIAPFLVGVSKLTGHPPVLSYVSYALHNWRRLDAVGPIELGNLALMQYFLGGLDEAWFTLVHVAMEARAGRAIRAAVDAQQSAIFEKPEWCVKHLNELREALVDINAVFRRMPERCDPYIYYNRVRPWIHGWHNQPSMPDGVVYEGVEEYAGKPQKFFGETGAQSSIAPVLDAALGVVHAEGPLSSHLTAMRAYMPPLHGAFIAAVEKRPPIRPYAAVCDSTHEAYNGCIHELWEFRKLHFEYAARYIFKQENTARKSGVNPTAVGTGGTSFMESLKKHLNETLAAKI